MKKVLFVVLLSLIVSGCAERQLEVLSVEFSSGAVVEDVNIALLDGETEEVIETKRADEEGRVMFTDLKHNHPYMISNASLHEAVLSHPQRFTYTKEMTYIVFETHYAYNTQGLAVPAMIAPDSMKSGSAIVSLTSVLRYYDVPATMKEIYEAMPRTDFTVVDGHVQAPHPNEQFAGDAYTENGYVLAQPVVATAVQLLKKYEAAFSVYNASNLPNEEIMTIIRSGVPIIAWVTKDVADVQQGKPWQIRNTEETYTPITNLETVVIIGENAGKIQVLQSREGIKKYDTNRFLEMFQASGAQAVVIRK